LSDIGVRLAGRLAGITEDGKAQFAGSIRNVWALSDLKMGRLLGLIDAWGRDNGLDGFVAPPHRMPPTRVEASPILGMIWVRARSERHMGHRLPSGLFVA
jgi:putative flavoprotein involved in K+ transport